MEAEPHRVSRNERLAKRLRNKAYRDSYLGSRIRQFLAHQMRSFRGERSQAEFGRIIGQSQSVISERLESPAYGKWNLQTLLDIAAKLDVALIVQFVDWPTFVKFTHEITDETVRPTAFAERQLKEFLEPVAQRLPESSAERALAEMLRRKMWGNQIVLGDQPQTVDGLFGKPAANENENKEPEKPPEKINGIGQYSTLGGIGRLTE
jgi:hypothetical protein